MILTIPEIAVIRPALALIEHMQHANIIMHMHVPLGRSITLDISASGITIKAQFLDSGPAVEHYRSPMGMAQAYGLSLAQITNRAD